MGSKKIAALVVASLLIASPALAAPSPSPEEREAARHLMDEGKARLKSGELARAVEAYKKAHEIMHVPTTGIALARTHYQMGHLVEARDLANEVLHMPKEAGEPPVFEAARKQARDLDAQIKGRIPMVRVHIRGEPAKKLTVDEVEIPIASLGEPIPMNPGSRIIAAYTADGYEAKTQIALSEKDSKEIELELLPGKAKSDPNASSSQSGARKVTGPSLEGGDGGSGERTGAANALIYGGFGLAVVGLVAGGVTGAMAFSKAGTVKDQCENGICDPSVQADLDSTKSLATVSNISFAAAGVGVVLGVIGLVLPKSHGTASRSGVFVGLGGAGLRGSF